MESSGRETICGAAILESGHSGAAILESGHSGAAILESGHSNVTAASYACAIQNMLLSLVAYCVMPFFAVPCSCPCSAGPHFLPSAAFGEAAPGHAAMALC